MSNEYVDDDIEFDPDAPPQNLEAGRTYTGHIQEVTMTGWKFSEYTGLWYQGLRIMVASPDHEGRASKTYWQLWEAENEEGDDAHISRSRSNPLWPARSIVLALTDFIDIGLIERQKGHVSQQLDLIITQGKGHPVIFTTVQGSGSFLNVSSLQAWPEGEHLKDALPF